MTRESQIWNQLKGGDKRALEEIYRAHVQRLYQYGRRFTKDDQLVEDCIQDLFIELWKNRKGLGDTDSVERYLLAATRRKIVRQLTKLKKVSATDQESDFPFSVELAIDQQLIDTEVSQENTLKIKQAFDELSKRQKEAIYLKYYAGLDYSEIEEVMKINYQSARNLVSGGLKKMKSTLGLALFFCFLNFFGNF